jgi:hypothetical protein
MNFLCNSHTRLHFMFTKRHYKRTCIPYKVAQSHLTDSHLLLSMKFQATFAPSSITLLKERGKIRMLYMTYIYMYIYIYLTVIGLTPGGSNTAHLYIQIVHRTHRTEHIQQSQNWTCITIKSKYNIKKLIAKCGPSLRVIPWHLPYNWRKSMEKPQLG